MIHFIALGTLVSACTDYPGAQLSNPETEDDSDKVNTRYISNYDGDDLDEPPMAFVDTRVIRELSGIIPAHRTHEYWGLSDRGNDEEIYRFNREGEILQIVELDGTENIDWEAITRDRSGNLYIGDIGDNDYVRKFYSIYKCPEPDEEVYEVDDEEIVEYRFHFSDGRSHNCEAMFFFRDKLFIVSKVEPFNEPARIFRIDELEEGQMLEAGLVGELDLNSEVTDAAYSLAFNTIVLLTYDDIIFFPIHEESDVLAYEPILVEIDFDQCEAICFDGGEIVVGNEDGELWFYPVNRFLQASPGSG